MTTKIEMQNKMKYSKDSLINEIVCLYKEFHNDNSSENFDRLVRFNNIFKKQYNCEFMSEMTYYFDHNTENFVSVN